MAQGSGYLGNYVYCAAAWVAATNRQLTAVILEPGF